MVKPWRGKKPPSSLGGSKDSEEGSKTSLLRQETLITKGFISLKNRDFLSLKKRDQLLASKITILVIDLSDIIGKHIDKVAGAKQAVEEVGFFQVVNHRI
jgi:hypothetical protein